MMLVSERVDQDVGGAAGGEEGEGDHQPGQLDPLARPVQAEADQQRLGQHVRVQQPPEDDDQSGQWRGQPLGALDMRWSDPGLE